MASKPIKTCVLGVGLGGLVFHVPFVLSLPQYFTLYAVMERNPATPTRGKAHERFGAKMDGVKIIRTYEEVLSDKEVELVVISTPSETHYALAKQAVEAGKHVLVDKPVVATSAQGKELGALAKEKGVVLYGFQNRRWDSDYLALRRLLKLPASSPQSLGNVYEFESRFDRYRDTLKGTWKDEPLPANGQVFDLGSHIMDQILQLFGRPKGITAFIQNSRGIGHPDVDDSFTILFHYPPTSAFPHALTAILRAHILSVKSPQVRYVVRGTKGTFSKFGVDIQEDQLKVIASPDEIISDPNYGKEPEDIWGSLENLTANGEVVKSQWPTEEKGCYVELFKNLAEAIRNGAELAVKWEEATAVIEMIELAYKSSKEMRTVEVPQA
ncbi:hypothetical protein JAAARDRAFT_28352 [Jaapia argillacea MUCL 33604]|uniref:Gfo/Idh/MocA-like oxidoreductase N-terminal domain-containing protein n=1 Tax=Jaapia argillacea MUCL 33604 TaxID=933084 RepID=A0A067QMF1_9AGAM|nr:hypothetical protein JAAARDRAFT_28352 [Jaapia argillacea MUCL 33604]